MTSSCVTFSLWSLCSAASRIRGSLVEGRNIQGIGPAWSEYVVRAGFRFGVGGWLGKKEGGRVHYNYGFNAGGGFRGQAAFPFPGFPLSLSEGRKARWEFAEISNLIPHPHTTRTNHLVGQKQRDGLDTLLRPVHVVPEKQIIGRGGEAVRLEQPQQVVVLSVDVATNRDRGIYL